MIILKNKNDNKSKLLFTDTDSLMYEIKTEDVYEDFSSDKEMFDFSNYTFFFYKQPSRQGSNVKNDLKIKQLAKQTPTLKTLMQKTLVGAWVKNFTFSILSSLNLNFSTTFLLCAVVFRADTGNNRKIVSFTFSCLYTRPIKVVGLLKFGGC